MVGRYVLFGRVIEGAEALRVRVCVCACRRTHIYALSRPL